MRKRKLTIKLVKAAVIIAILLVVSGGVFWYMAGQVESLETSLKRTKSSIAQSKEELKTLKKEVANSNDANAFYEEYIGTEDSDLNNFRKVKVRQILSDIKSKLNLNSLSYKMELFKELEGGKFAEKHAVTIKTDIVVEFAAIDDLKARELLREIEKQFPGHVFIRSFTLKALKDNITDNDFLQTGRGDMPNLVDGKVEFDWFGVKVFESDEPEGGDDA